LCAEEKTLAKSARVEAVRKKSLIGMLRMGREATKEGEKPKTVRRPWSQNVGPETRSAG
jgi:hypothetical protein